MTLEELLQLLAEVQEVAPDAVPVDDLWSDSGPWYPMDVNMAIVRDSLHRHLIERSANRLVSYMQTPDEGDQWYHTAMVTVHTSPDTTAIHKLFGSGDCELEAMANLILRINKYYAEMKLPS